MYTFIYIILKDIRLILLRSNGIMQSVMLGILIVFVFSLSQPVGQVISAQTASALFSLSSVFCVILITNALFSLEQEEGIHIALLLSPLSLSSIAFAKICSSFIVLSITQCFLLPATFIFLSQNINSFLILFMGILLLNAGITSMGVLLGAITGHSSAKDSLLSVLLFPLLLPLLLTVIKIIEYALYKESIFSFSWFAISLSFVLFFFSATIILFPLVYASK